MEELMRGLSPREHWLVQMRLNAVATFGQETILAALRAEGQEQVAEVVETLLTQMGDKVSFVVVDEHTLGCINPMQPNNIQILHGSILRGAQRTWQDGTLMRPLGDKRMRPATRQDFIDFNLGLDQYARHPERYNIPEV